MKTDVGIHHSREAYIFMLSFWILYTVYIIHSAYFISLYISPDSSYYMREAESLLSGCGFNVNGAAGVPGYFSAWPIGYPALIALSSAIFGCNVYLASKILTAALICLELFILSRRYRIRAWLYALILTNYGIISINRFTWSETAFMPLLLIYALSLSEILRSEYCPAKYYIFLWLSMSGAFMVRYFGVFTVIVSLFAVLILLFFRAYDSVGKTKAGKSRILKLLVTAFSAGLFMAGYLLMNKIVSGYATGVDRAVFTDDIKLLATNLFWSVIGEMKNISSFISPRLNIRGRYIALMSLPFMAVSAYVIVRRFRAVIREKKFDEASVFLFTGLCYYVIFIAVRFRSSMDPFNYRFWAPASMLILIGLVTCFCERFSFNLWEKRVQIVASAVMAVLAVFIAFRDFRTITGNSAYDMAREEVSAYFEGVPSGSAILVCEGWKDDEGNTHKGEEYYYPYANFFRKDLIIARTFRVTTDYSMENLLNKHRDCKYIAISKFCYENEISASPSRYPEIISAFSKGDSVRNFIIIPVKAGAFSESET